MDKKHIVQILDTQLKICQNELSEPLRFWLNSHLIEPYQILVKDENGEKKVRLWLITDDNGLDDASYKIVYDSANKMFGLITSIKSSSEVYLGGFGDLKEVVENM